MLLHAVPFRGTSVTPMNLKVFGHIVLLFQLFHQLFDVLR